MFIIPIGLTLPMDVKELKTNALDSTLQLNLPKVYIMPDSPLYGIKKSWEYLMIMLCGSNEQKMNLLMDFAEVRLAEAVEMIKTNNQDKLDIVMNEYNDTIEQIGTITSELNPSKISQHVTTKLEVDTKKVELLELLAGEYKIEWSR